MKHNRLNEARELNVVHSVKLTFAISKKKDILLKDISSKSEDDTISVICSFLFSFITKIHLILAK